MLKIALDIDDTILKWRQAHETKFNCKISKTASKKIGKQVLSVKDDESFWTNLQVEEYPTFDPYCYATKRINPKRFTISNLKKHNLPIKPIIQFYNQEDNKADKLKGVVDILIDDSWFNVKQCLEAGMPALLITRPHNKWVKTKYRITHLDYKEIENKYNELF